MPEKIGDPLVLKLPRLDFKSITATCRPDGKIAFDIEFKFVGVA